MSRKQYIAVDLGAESGRVVLGAVTSDKLSLQEVRRFPNGPIEENGSLHWDFEKLFSEIKKGLAKAVKTADAQICGIGVDSWGVDFGLIDGSGKLLENPYCYRDSRTDNMMEKAFESIPRREFYENTGIQFMQLNTAFQLLAASLTTPDVLQKADKLLFTADLVSYFLSGSAYAEYTLASTSQLMDMHKGEWSKEVFEKLGLPVGIMPNVVQAGTVIGKLKSELAEELGIAQIPIAAAGSHDTADAVAAIPVKAENWAYLSSGTWSLMGVEVPEAIINDETYKYGFTNEGGVKGTIRLLKNIMGLWLVQQCRSQWQSEGTELSYSEIVNLASGADAFKAYVNTSDARFLAPGDMPARINEFLKESGQNTIDDKGQIIRTVLESLAFNYRWVLERIEEIIGKRIDVLQVVGGGIKNELLCQFAANATGRKVITGPVEATASGNIIMQAIANGQIDSVATARSIVANSFELKEYQPQDFEVWDKQYRKVEGIFAS